MNWTRLTVVAVLMTANSAWAQPYHEPLWEVPSTIEHVREVAALEDVDGDGLDDLFVFHDWPNGFAYRVYKAGVPPSAASLLEFRSFDVPNFAFRSTVGSVIKGPGQDLILSYYDPYVGGSTAWYLFPDFRTAPFTPIVCPRLKSPTWTWTPERYRGLDFDQDGFDDFAAPRALDGYPFKANALFFGSENGPIVAGDVDGRGTDQVATELLPDINGDGYPDIVTTMVDFPWSIDICFGGPGADLVTDLQLILDPDDYPTGRITHLSDFDGDGSPDFATGLAAYQTKVAIYRGGAALDDQADLIFYHPAPGGSWSGAKMVDIGDVNGDGYDDLAIPYGSMVFLFHGGPGADTIPDSWIYDVPQYVSASHIFPVGDWTGDGRGEVLFGGGIYSPQIVDMNEDGIHDFYQLELLGDCDDDGYPDPFELSRPGMVWELDCNENGLIDHCELTQDPSLDCDQDGRPDVCNIQQFPHLDCDRNGVLDECQGPPEPEMDCNGDGIVDVCQINDPDLNCDLNALLDDCERPWPNTWLDCDGDRQLDRCEISGNSSLDVDGNGRLDVCQDPVELFLAFDAAGTVTEFTTSTSAPTELFVIFDSDPGFDRTLVTKLSLRIELAENLFSLSSEMLLPGAVDLLPGSGPGLDFWFSVAEPLPSSGPVPLIRVDLHVLAAANNAIVSLVENSLSAADPLDAPVWTDIGDTDHFFGEFRSAFINRTFADCNGNELDDEMDILTGYSEDLDLDSIPDECAISVDAPAAARTQMTFVRPNPFNPRTELSFVNGVDGHVHLEIYDVAGRRVRTLASGYLSAGPHSRIWDGRNANGQLVASGVYYYRLRTPDADLQGKMALIR